MLELIAIALCGAWAGSMFVVAIMLARSYRPRNVSFWEVAAGCALLILSGPITLADCLMVQWKETRG